MDQPWGRGSLGVPAGLKASRDSSRMEQCFCFFRNSWLEATKSGKRLWVQKGHKVVLVEREGSLVRLGAVSPEHYQLWIKCQGKVGARFTRIFCPPVT